MNLAEYWFMNHTTKVTPAPWITHAWRPVLALAFALLVTLAGILFTGASKSQPLQDPGAFVRFGAPLSSTLNDVAAALTVSALVFAAGVLGFPSAKNSDWKPTWDRCVSIAGVSAIVWTFAGLSQLLFFAATASGLSFTNPNYVVAFGEAMNTDLARAQLMSIALAAIVATVAIGSRSLGGIGIAAVLALLAVLPKSVTGHAAGSGDHETAVTAMALHLLGACIWLGGVLVVMMLASTLRKPEHLAAVMRRFSTLALLAFVLVAISGVVAAWIRMSGFDDLATRWGVVLLGKVGALVALGIAGFWQRRWILSKLATEASIRTLFWRLMLGELVVLLLATGLAGALAVTAPPLNSVAERPLVSPAEVLTGYPLPPALDSGTFFSVWRMDVFGLALCITLAFVYLASLVKLQRRGDSWPILRTVNWLVGISILCFALLGSPGVYGRVLFSSHMLEHMMLSMLIPLFLCGGAPVTLLLRALAPRTDGSRGAREWLLWVLDSRFSQFMTHPIVAAANFAGGLIVFYFSDIFRFAMNNHVGHMLMVFHFLLVGYVFCNSLVGIDPTHKRYPYPIRVVMLLATMGFHAFFGVTLMSSQELLAAEWFGAMGRTWGPSALDDQHLGGQIAWGIGEVPTLGLALLVARQWFASDSREAKRRDRKVERDGDTELDAYNDMLAARSGRVNQPATGSGSEPAATAPEK